MVVVIFYRGRGKRILGFVLLGALIAFVLIFALPEGFRSIMWMAPAVAWGAAIGSWLAAWHLRVPKFQTTIDPATGMSISSVLKDDLFLLPPLVWSILATVCALGVTFMAVIVETHEREMLADPSSGYAAFKAADEMLNSNSGPTSKGNSSTADKIAANFSEAANTFLPDSSVTNRPTVWCQLNPDSCVFLLHVPGLSRLPTNIKKHIEKTAWNSAALIASGLSPIPRQCVVAIRGSTVYNPVLIGSPPVKFNGSVDEPSMVIRDISSKVALREYFKPVQPGAKLPVVVGRMEFLGEDDQSSAAKPQPLLPLPQSPPAPAAESAQPRTTPAQIPSSTSLQNPFINSLGMKFVPVPRTKVLFCIRETRKRDYMAFCEANPSTNRSWLKKTNAEGLANPGDDYPACFVSWIDARAFCEWLSSKERLHYRLPTDHEWSCAVGLADEDASASPEAKSGKSPGKFPWGSAFPPPQGAANLSDESSGQKNPKWIPIKGYSDGYTYSAPVMKFAPNDFGLYDMAGNLAEWCEDTFSAKNKSKTTRGSSYSSGSERSLCSDFRSYREAHEQWTGIGFRVVVEAQAGQ